MPTGASQTREPARLGGLTSSPPHAPPPPTAKLGSPLDPQGLHRYGGPQSIGRSRGGLNTAVHLVAAGLEQILGFCLSPGQAHDAPVGRDLLASLGVDNLQIPLIMDRAYEGDETRYLVQSLFFEPVVLPKENRLDPWPFDPDL
jgi:hypothetical protein